MSSKLKLLDVVALLINLPEEHLEIGQVGTIVEILGEDAYEIEFVNTKGRTLAVCAVEGENLLKLKHELAFA